MLLSFTVFACANKPAEPEATRTDGSAATEASDDAAPSAASAKNLRNYLKGTWKVDSVEGIDEGIVQEVDGKVTFSGSSCDLMKSGNNPLSIEAASESVSFGNGETIDGRITISDKAGNVTFDVNAIDGDTLELRQGEKAVIKLSRTSADVVVKGGGQAQQQGQPQQNKNKESVVGGYLIGDWETPDGRRVTFDGTYTNYISDDAAWPYVVSDDEYTIEIMPKEGDHEIFWVRIEDDDYIRLSRDGNRVYLTRLSHTPTKPEEGDPAKPEEGEDKKDEAEAKEEEAKKAEEEKAAAEEKAEESEKANEKAEEPVPVEVPEKKGSTYRLISEAVTWDAAKAACESMGGHLVTIESADELSQVYDIIAGSSLHAAWIGLSREGGSWTWVTGEGATFTNWAPDKPSSDGGNYVEMFVDTGNDARGSMGQWNNSAAEGGSDFYSLDTKGYICEWD